MTARIYSMGGWFEPADPQPGIDEIIFVRIIFLCKFNYNTYLHTH